MKSFDIFFDVCLNKWLSKHRNSASDLRCCDVHVMSLWWSYGDCTIPDDVIKWKYFPRYWPFVWGIHRSPVNSPHKGPVTWNLDVFFDLHLNKRFSKQSWGWWFETSSCSLWRHCNASQGVSVVSFLENMIVDALAKPRDIENLGGFSPLNSIYWGSVTVAFQMISDKISVWSVSRYVDSVGYIEQGDY